MSVKKMRVKFRPCADHRIIDLCTGRTKARETRCYHLVEKEVFLPLVEPDTEGNKERAFEIAAQLYIHIYWKSAILRNLHRENNYANHESYEKRVIVKSLPLLFMCSGKNTQSGNTQATTVAPSHASSKCERRMEAKTNDGSRSTIVRPYCVQR